MSGDWRGTGLWEGSAGARLLRGAGGGSGEGGAAGGGRGPPRSCPPSASSCSESGDKKGKTCSHQIELSP